MRQFINKINSRIIIFTDDMDKAIKKYECNEEWDEMFEFDAWC